MGCAAGGRGGIAGCAELPCRGRLVGERSAGLADDGERRRGGGLGQQSARMGVDSATLLRRGIGNGSAAAREQRDGSLMRRDVETQESRISEASTSLRWKCAGETEWPGCRSRGGCVHDDHDMTLEWKGEPRCQHGSSRASLSHPLQPEPVSCGGASSCCRVSCCRVSCWYRSSSDHSHLVLCCSQRSIGEWTEYLPTQWRVPLASRPSSGSRQWVS